MDYLREKRGFTYISLVEAIEEKGLKVNRCAVGRYRKGLYWSARLTYLQAYCSVFGVSLPEMLSRDFRAEDEAGRADSE